MQVELYLSMIGQPSAVRPAVKGDRVSVDMLKGGRRNTTTLQFSVGK